MKKGSFLLQKSDPIILNIGICICHLLSSIHFLSPMSGEQEAARNSSRKNFQRQLLSTIGVVAGYFQEEGKNEIGIMDPKEKRDMKLKLKVALEALKGMLENSK